MPEMLVEMEQVRLWILALIDCCHTWITESGGKETGAEGDSVRL